MSEYVESAKNAVLGIKANMSVEVASSRALVAIALALIAIAEEMESDKVKDVRDRTWLYERGE